jgi:hypothetical protein
MVSTVLLHPTKGKQVGVVMIVATPIVVVQCPDPIISVEDEVITDRVPVAWDPVAERSVASSCQVRYLRGGMVGVRGERRYANML